MKIAFIGLGVMGGPMATHLAKKQFDLTAYNRTQSKALAWQKNHPTAKINNSLEELVKNAELIISCIGKDDDVAELAEVIYQHAKQNTYWVDHTTTSAKIARAIAKRLTARQIEFIDAPVSGGEAGAINGSLTVMCGGKQTAFDAVSPVLKSYAKQLSLIGESGSGQLTKMVNQICLAGVVQGLSEGLYFAKRVGLDCEKVIEAISKGAAQSWQMDNRAQSMVEGRFDFGVAVDWMRKDLRICLDEAAEKGLKLEALALIDSMYEKIQAKGCGRLDTSALIKQFD